jgi:hypothetical protein
LFHQLQKLLLLGEELVKEEDVYNDDERPFHICLMLMRPVRHACTSLRGLIGFKSYHYAGEAFLQRAASFSKSVHP